MQAETPIAKVKLWDGSTPWLVTRYDDQRTLFTDPRISADGSNPDLPTSGPGIKESQQQGQAFIRMDDPEHARQRRMVAARFTAKRVQALRPAIQKIVDGLIDDMLAGPKPVELVDAFALAVPSLVICELLGVPYADRSFFQQNAKQFSQHEATGQQAAEAQRQLVGYLAQLIEEKLANPGDDVMSDVAGRVKDGELSRDDAALMGMLLLVGGHETTANMIALGTLALLWHPEQLAILRATDDQAVIAGAVEELLRYLTILHNGLARVALTDIEIGGRTIRAGEGVVLPIEAANRDSSVFPETGPAEPPAPAPSPPGLCFRSASVPGPAPCARRTAGCLRHALQAHSTLRLAADPGELSFKHDALAYGLNELPVTW